MLIKKGTVLDLPIAIIHTNEKYHKDAMKFDIDRWKS